MPSTVKQVAERVGLPSRTVRYYDRIGLVTATQRSEAGYRLYSAEDEGRLRFIQQAKTLGLSLPQIRGLIAAAEGGCSETLPELQRLLEHNIEQIDARISELKAFRDRLADYAAGKSTVVNPHRCGHGSFCGCLDDVPEP